MNRSEILKTAETCVCGHREQDYGSPENNFQKIADLWNAYLGFKYRIDARDVALMMSLLKIARASTDKPTDDCFVDLAGYAACAGEIMSGSAES